MTAHPPAPSQTQRWISQLRFEAFLLETGGDHDRAWGLYIWNTELAGALMEALGHVEVLLRNAVHTQLKSGRPGNALSSWLLDRDILAPRDLERVQDVVARLKQARKQPTEDRVLAGLSMGFWAAIFGTHYEQLWRDALRHAFAHGDGTRHQIAGYVNRIASLRNRAAHHEPLIAQPVAKRHDDALALMGTVDPHAEVWLRSLSRVPALLAARPA
jgi:hypothetical protein